MGKFLACEKTSPIPPVGKTLNFRPTPIYITRMLTSLKRSHIMLFSNFPIISTLLSETEILCLGE